MIKRKVFTRAGEKMDDGMSGLGFPQGHAGYLRVPVE